MCVCVYIYTHIPVKPIYVNELCILSYVVFNNPLKDGMLWYSLAHSIILLLPLDGLWTIWMLFEQLRLKEEYLKMKRIMIAYEIPQ